ncbi:MAG: hypothetical protein FWD97_00885 [Defluviitaleaceae bacterium]|nr:hypothetical protein [Defluviitaleaceae bacterium]
MDRVEIMVEAMQSPEQEWKISEIAKIKYRLPAIGLYVVEVCRSRVNCLKAVDGVGNIMANAVVSTQISCCA